MTVELNNPDGVFKPDSYFQASVCAGSRIVCISDQVAIDDRGHVVGKGDLSAQSQQAYRDLFSWLPEKMEHLVSGATRAAQDLGFDPRRPMTMMGVATLASPDLLVEVEALAILP